MIKQALADLASGIALKVLRGLDGTPTLAVESYQRIHGAFAAITSSGVATTLVAAPDGSGALILTDLLVSTEKRAGSTVVIQFTDGANTVTIIDLDTATDPVVFAHAFQGRWSGWQGARLEMVTDVALQRATCAIGYVKVPETSAPTYAEWLALQ